MKRVLVTEPIHEAGMSLLRARPGLDVVHADDTRPETLARLVDGVHGIAVRTAKLPAEILAQAKDLEVVSRHGVGCDNVDVAHLTGRGIPVAITAGANSRAVAEHTLGLMLSLTRRLPAQDSVVRSGRWRDRDRFRAIDLYGATVLIIGFGRIGRLVAPLCKAFGMEVVVADIALDAELARAMECRGIEDFHPELPAADFVTLHVPLDASTRNLISDAEFAAMKPGAVLINCARGGIVNEMALLAALEGGGLGGAGVDVFVDEPPPPDHPLFGRDDVILTPHNAAATVLAAKAMATMTVQNIFDVFDGCLAEECIFNADALRRQS